MDSIKTHCIDAVVEGLLHVQLKVFSRILGMVALACPVLTLLVVVFQKEHFVILQLELICQGLELFFCVDVMEQLQKNRMQVSVVSMRLCVLRLP